MAVRLTWPLTADVAEAIVNEPGDEIIDHAVVALSPLLPGRDQPEMAQERELVAHSGHGEPQSVSEISHAKLSVRERVHQSKTKRIRQGQEHLYGLGGGFLGGEIRAELRDLLPVVDVGQVRSHS